MIAVACAARLRARRLPANYTLSHCYGSPDGNGGGTTNVVVGYNIPSNPAYDNGNCTVDRLHNFDVDAPASRRRTSRSATLRMVASGWRLVGSFRATTGPWLTVTTGVGRRAQRPARHAAREPDQRHRLRRPVDEPGERLRPLARSERVRAAGQRHVRQHGAQRRPRSGHQERRPGADAGVPVGGRKASRSAPRRSTRSTGSSSGTPQPEPRRARRSARSRSALSAAHDSAGGEIHLLDGSQSSEAEYRSTDDDTDAID